MNELKKIEMGVEKIALQFFTFLPFVARPTDLQTDGQNFYRIDAYI